ncbi:MAG: TonB-dependent receptor family protein [Steroidobacteraceae bacterium]
MPAAITVVSGERLQDDTLGEDISDDLGAVPGLLARNRHNYAQDQQISIRGIGANSPFGVRGVRLYQDGIPATGPDGQGQVSQFDLGSAARVEVLEGPFSALYGNSSGGVIQIFTAEGQGPPKVRGTLVYGSFDNLRASVDASGSRNGFSYNADLTHFSVDGYRPHSGAVSNTFNTKLGYAFSDGSHLTIVANAVIRPNSQDPVGLTQAEFAADPYSTNPVAAEFNTRKTLQQEQGGLTYDRDLGAGQSIQVMGYYGHRIIQQYLPIPIGAQAAPGSSGGVIDLNREFGGGDAHWTWKGSVADRPMSWVVGMSFDSQNELRRGYDNFIGTTLGVQGALRRDENDIVRDLDEYAQGTWDFAPKWSLMVGARHSEVTFDSHDHFITPKNGDGSGSVTYTANSPVAGLMFKVLPWLHLYAAYGRGFQTPLGSELAYRPDGATGLDLGLRPARSDNSEVGAKLRLGSQLLVTADLFQTLTADEIVVDTNIDGRSTYQNSGRTRRQGAELSIDYRFAHDWRTQLAYTYVDAYYSDAYVTCTAAPCGSASVLVAAGNLLPGVPKSDLYASLRWGGDEGWHAGLNAQYLSAVPVNDENTVFAPAYAIFGVDGGYSVKLAHADLSVFLRINNLFDRHYVGSVIVDDGNGRYFEPGPGIEALSGVTVTLD